MTVLAFPAVASVMSAFSVATPATTTTRLSRNHTDDKPRMNPRGRDAAYARTAGFGVRGLVRAFRRRLVAVECGEGAHHVPRAAERGSAWPTSRPGGESVDESPHSRSLSFGCE